MSRRYGRRQKRAARERILDLSCITRNLQSRLEDGRMEHRKLRNSFDDLKEQIIEWDKDIRSMLGPYTSFAINDTTFRLDHPDQLRQMEVMPRLSLGVSDYSAIESFSYYVERVLHLVTTLEEQDIMTLSRYMSLQLKVGSDREGYSAYTMSESYWRHLQQSDAHGRARVIRRLAEDMLRVLIEGEKEKKAAALRAAQSRPRAVS